MILAVQGYNMETLDVGKHRLTIVPTDFEVLAAEGSKIIDPGKPQTGDNAIIIFWFGITYIIFAGLGIAYLLSRKKREAVI